MPPARRGPCQVSPAQTMSPTSAVFITSLDDEKNEYRSTQVLHIKTKSQETQYQTNVSTRKFQELLMESFQDLEKQI